MAMVDPFGRLDLHVIALVVELLNPVDIVRLQRVSHHWNSTLGSEYIARVALLAHFPHSPEAIELVDNNAKGKTKEIQEDQLEKPAKRRRKSRTDEKKPAPEVVSFRRATFRLHTRALAKPSKVHKYRLHHVSEKSFTATSTHLFWAESNRNIWVQSIGEGVGGRRSLRLRSFGDTIAHLYQIVATETGLVIVLFREVGSWNLVLMALEHQTDKVIWKINPVQVPVGLQVTSRHIYYTIGATAQFPHQPPILPGMRNADIYIHSLETSKLLHKASLQTPVIGECSVVPGSYIIYPPAEPTKIFATYDVQTLSGACRSVVRVYSIDGAFLHRFDLDRPAVDVSRYRPDLSLRLTILPAVRGGEPEKIMLIESTSRPHTCRHESYTHADRVQSNNPVLSAWIVNPDTHEVEEIRRYFSTYAENEKVPIMESGRGEPLGGEYTRLECLDAIRGISYIYYDENKKKEPMLTAEEDQHLNGVQPVRAWYESGGARIDSMCYEEQFSREIDTGLPIKQEHFSDLLSSAPPHLEGFHSDMPVNLVHTTPWAWITNVPIISRPYPSPLGSPFHNAKSTETIPQATWKPVVRHYLQSSRHKLVQPDIMRRRRRHNLGEEEEDWQLLPVKTGPMIFMDVKSGGETSNDGRFVFLLAKCSGWSITCFGSLFYTPIL
ncbi:hypothetical protein BGX38DRAFT_1140333 [Terfezia claveryi]|nr:hypothetical protein BGX38DRAFT_1140333 [Terfezia claveryi]